jgi:hypothetical protein
MNECAFFVYPYAYHPEVAMQQQITKIRARRRQEDAPPELPTPPQQPAVSITATLERIERVLNG